MTQAKFICALAAILVVTGCGDGSTDEELSATEMEVRCDKNPSHAKCQSCGDAVCAASESCSSCPADCGACASCGDATCNGTETCSSCAADCGACSTGVGPQASITCPAGAVSIAVGQDIPAIVSSHPTGTTFCIQAGVHYPAAPINPRAGQTLVGQYGAILDGSSLAPMSYDVGSTSIIRGWNCTDCTNVTVRNLVIRNLPGYSCIGNNFGGYGWLIDHNEVSGCRWGINTGSNSVISNNYTHHHTNGGGYSCYKCTNTSFLNNEIAFNEPEHKVTLTTNVTFSGNFVHHNAEGIWYDGDNTGSLIENNIVEDNAGEGIFYEISGQGIIRNNTIRRSGRSGIFVSTSRDVEIYGNVLEGNWRGINYFVNCDILGHSAGSPYPEAIGWDLRNVNAHDNTIYIGTQNEVVAGSLGYLGTCTSTQVAPYMNGSKNLVFQSNAYYAPSMTTKYWFWGDSWKSFSEWQALGHDTLGSVKPQ